MRANEFLKEAIAPIAPISGNQPAAGQDQLGAAIAQAEQPQAAQPQTTQSNKTAVIDVIRTAANKQPVKPTGNPGLDDLLFKQAALSKGPGLVGNLVGRGLNAIGGAFAAQTSIQRAKFDRPMRSGAQMRAGLTAEPNAGTAVSQGQQQARGLAANVQAKAATDEQVISLIKSSVTPNKPVNSTQNRGIDQLLTKAGVLTSEKPEV
jgi:hypothetical protein